MADIEDVTVHVMGIRDDVAELLTFVDELFPEDSGRPNPEVRARDHEGERGL